MLKKDPQFDLNTALDHWVRANCSREKLTASDMTEIREHMLFTIEDLMEEKGLPEQEAFAVAEVRFGGEADWGEEMQQMNRENFELRKVVSLIAGFFIYFLCQNLIFLSAGLLMTILETHTENAMAENLQIMQFYIYGCYIVTIGVFIAMLFYRKQVIRYLSGLKIRYIYSVLFVFLLVVVFFSKRIFRYKAGELILEGNDNYFIFRDALYSILNIYPILFSIGFLLVWFYYNKRQARE